MKTLITGLLMLTTTALVAQDVNTRILEYVDANKGEQIDRGECWDVVNAALNHSEAHWQSPKGFGRKITKRTSSRVILWSLTTPISRMSLAARAFLVTLPSFMMWGKQER